MSVNKSNFETNRTDIVASIAKGITGACPVVGGLIAEAVNYLIPNQKLDRITDFLIILDQKVSRLESELSDFKANITREYGLDLLEDVIVQASRAVTAERRGRLANLLAKSLSSKEMKYLESKKLLNLLQELTDPELIWLLYFSKTPTFESEYHEHLEKKYPEILKPADPSVGASEEERARGALQDSYKNTLVRLGLLGEREHTYRLTSLGFLLLRYIENEANSAESKQE